MRVCHSARFATATIAVLSVMIFGLRASVAAETPVERGKYLMSSIVACGNCHTPKGPNGKGTPKGPAAKAAAATDQPETAAVRAKPTRLAAKGAKASADKKAPADLGAPKPQPKPKTAATKAKKSSAKKKT